MNPKLIGVTHSPETSTLGKRDAFHVPCILVKSRYYLEPGWKVVFINKELTEVIKCDDCDSIYHGIIDPFIDRDIQPGQLFWVFLNPNLVSNVTHHFSVDIKVPEPEDDDYDECRGCY